MCALASMGGEWDIKSLKICENLRCRIHTYVVFRFRYDIFISLCDSVAHSANIHGIKNTSKYILCSIIPAYKLIFIWKKNISACCRELSCVYFKVNDKKMPSMTTRAKPGLKPSPISSIISRSKNIISIYFYLNELTANNARISSLDRYTNSLVADPINFFINNFIKFIHKEWTIYIHKYTTTKVITW